MGYILDADWVVNALAKRRSAHTILNRLAPSGLAISWVTVGEIYEGAFGFSNPEPHLAAFRQFLHPLSILGLDDPTMERFAEIRSSLRRRGELIPDFDILLAATALRHDLVVLSFNIEHFERVPEVRLYPGE